MLEAWSASQFDAVLLSIAHGEPKRCWRRAVEVMAGIDAMFAGGGRGGLSESVASWCKPKSA
jgi:hypothetical protein